MTAVRRVLAGALLIAAFVRMTQDAALAASYDNHELNAAQQRISTQAEAGLETLSEDVVKSSAIEGERLDSTLVHSSLARRLGIDIGGVSSMDRHIKGVVEMMLDATQRYTEPLTKERLIGWHSAPEKQTC